MRLNIPLAIVAAVAVNGAIGAEGRLPWTMPGDLARFRDLTMGKPMIMGRRTFQSIGRALPGRESIVVTRDEGSVLPAGVHRAASIDAAMSLADTRARDMGADEVSLIGGATLFERLIGSADILYMTFVALEPPADTFFPAIDPAVWRETSRHVPPRHPRDEADCVFVDYARR